MAPQHNPEKSAVRVFTQEEARRIVDEVVSYMDPKGQLFVQVSSWWGAGQRWARNRAALSSDQREITVTVGRRLGNVTSSASTNQTDSTSLKGIAQHIDFYYHRWVNKIPPDKMIDRPKSDAKGAEVWSDDTFNRSVVDNAVAVEELTRVSEAEQLLSSGYIETTGATSLKYVRDEWERPSFEWGRVTQAQCSVTVRHPTGVGSGWFGKTSYDIQRVNIARIANMAFEKCKRSLNPVRIEPGRYQTILEPQATATMTGILMGSLGRLSPEAFGRGPMFLGGDEAIRRYRSKLGLKIVDERLTIFHDPAAPFVGTHVAPLHGKAEYIKNGVLTALISDYEHYLNETSEINPTFPTTSYTVRGGNTSVEEMIASTKRGLLVARLAQPEPIDPDSLLYTGVTRDGLWLIEDGKITKAVRNFRWTESPLFVLNNIEQIGVEEQVFNPVSSRNPFGFSSFALSLNNVVVPPLKVNDFSFTSTIDAI
jgi:predicted Zn-dependent protease